MSEPAGEKRPTLISRSKEFLDGAVSGLKGRDLAVVVDEFTQEMTLVAEGLGGDLQKAQQDLSQLSASQTVQEESVRRMQEDLKALTRRVEALEKVRDKLKDNRGLHAILRQVTIIAAILSGAWVISAILKTFGG